MPAKLSLVQLGKGTVGAALIEQIREQRPALLRRLGVEIVYAGIAGKRSGAFEADGLDLPRWKDEVESGDLDGRKIVKKAFGGVSGSAVLVDAPAEEGVGPLYVEALSGGLQLVSLDKKPPARPLAAYLCGKEAGRR